MANEPKAVSPAVAAIVIIVAIAVIGLVGWYFMRPKPTTLSPKMMEIMKGKMKMGPMMPGMKGHGAMKGGYGPQ